MKPQSFTYLPTRELDAALEALAEAGGDASVLAGGQSLVPIMNLRLARPGVVVDINPIVELAAVDRGPDALRLGALVRHRALERGIHPGDALSALLAKVAGSIGHVPVRVRGTIGGSLAHADPVAEWCLVGLALGATVELAGRDRRRSLDMDRFLDGPFTTALEPEELLVALEIPRRGGWQYGFAEHAPTCGAFAEAGACTALRVEDDTVREALVAVMGTAGRARRLPAIEASLAGCPCGEAGSRAAEVCAETVDPSASLDLSSDYLRALAAAMVRRAVTGALASSGEAA